MHNDDDKKWLYDKLSKQGYKIGTYDEFTQSLDNEEDRKWYYDKANAMKLKIGSYDEFSQLFGSKPQQENVPEQTETPASQTTPDTPATPIKATHTQEEWEQMSPDNRLKNAGNIVQSENNPWTMEQEAAWSSLNPKTRQVIIGNEDIYKKFEAHLQEKEKEKNPESPSYVPNHPPMFNEYNAEQQEKKNDIRANRQQVANLSNHINDELNRRGKELDAEYKSSWWADIPRGSGGAIHTINSATNNGRMADQKYKDLMSARNSLTNAQRIINEADHNAQSGTLSKWLESSFAGGAARGFGQKLFDVRTWDAGFSDLSDNSSLMMALKAFDEGRPLTESQQMMLDAKAVELATTAYFGSYVGRGYKAGSVTAESIPFMLEMCINPASSTGKESVNAMTRYALKRFGEKTLEQNAKKYATAKIATRIAGDLLGSAAMAATTGSGRVIADAVDRMNGQITYGIEDGESVFTGHTEGESIGTAFAKAFASTTIENHSEMVGEYFAPVLGIVGKGVRRGFEKIGLGSVNKFMDGVAMSEVGKLVSDFEKSSKWNGTIGEYAEEVVGNIENALVVGDQTLDTDSDTGVFNLDQNIDTFLGVALMGGFLSSAKTLGYRTPKYRARKDMERKDDKAASSFGNQETWGSVRNTLAFGNDEDAANMLADVLTNPDYTEQQKRTTLDYAKSVKTYQGILKGEEKRRTDEDADPIQIDAETSFDNGYSLEEPQEQNDAKNMLDYRREQMKILFGLGDASEVDEFIGDPLQFISQQQSILPQENMQSIIDYINAKATYDGLIAKVQDGIEGKIAKSDSFIDGNTNEDGMILPATLKVDDRQVYVVNGRLVMNEDGNGIDTHNSDEFIVIRDAQTGNLETTNPHNILSIGEATDATAQKQLMADKIYQEEAQAAANRIDGVLPFSAGDTYTLTDEQGQQSNIQIVANELGATDNGDGTVNVTVDGQNIIPMSKEQIQQMYDATNLARLAQFEQEKAVQKAEESDTVPIEENGNTAISQEPVPEDAMPQQESPINEEETPSSALSRIPLNEKQEPDFEQADKKDTGDALLEINEFDVDEAKDTASQMVSFYDGEMKKAEKMKTAASTPMQIQKLKSEKRNKIAEIRNKIVYWQSVAEEIESRRKKPNIIDEAAAQAQANQQRLAEMTPDELAAAQIAVQEKINNGDYEKPQRNTPARYAKEEETLGEPLSAQEYILREIATGRMKFKWNDSGNTQGLGAHTGLGNAEAERKNRIWAFSNEGYTPEAASEQMFADMPDYVKRGIDQTDVFNMINDAFLSYSGPAAMFEEAKRLHGSDNIEEVPGYDADQERQRMEWEAEQNHMSVEEWRVYNEIMEEVLSSYLPPEEAINEFINQYIEEYERSTENSGMDEGIPEEQESSGSYEGSDGLRNADGIHRSGETEQTATAGEENSTAAMLGSLSETPVSGTENVNYKLSSIVSDNGEPFYQNEEGNIDLAIIPQEVFESIGKKSAPFRLIPSMLRHVFDRHGTEMSLTDPQDAISFVLDVINNFDHVRQGDKGALVFSIENGKNRTGRRAVTILLDSKNGDYYGIKTSGYERIDGLKKKALLWEKGAKVTSATDVASANVTTAIAQQGNGQPGSASDQRNAIPSDKDSKQVTKKQIPTDIFSYAEQIVKQREIEQAEKQVDLYPTEAQKKAGNYKKGHIKLDGYDISIENPKGSVRSGKDANGQEWSITMNNDYGYIRGTKAVDGDHIDIFLSDNPTEGNVFVVDQLNEDGVFDESKVMYGFPSLDEARSAYLSNYSPGWENRIGAITEVSKDEFKKWIDSSVRKTKPFSEYKSITPLSDEKDNEKSGSDGKLLDERPLSEDEISNSGAEQELKDGALAYLRGDVNFATQIAYQSIYNDVRDRSGNSERNSESSVPTQLGETADGDRGRTGSRRSGRSGNQLDKEGSESVISGNEERGQDSVPHLAEPFGKGSDKQVHESSSRTKGSSTGDTGRRGSGSNRSNGHNVRSRRGDRVGKTNVTVNGGRGTETDRERDSIADEINQLLDDWKKAGNDGTLSMTVIPGLNAERVKILSKLVVAGARYGFTYLKDGITGFKEWSGKIREMLGAPLSNVIGLTDAQIDDFIADMWNYPHTIDGRTMKLSQWAAELGGKELRKQVRMGLEEKKRLQDAAEPVKVKFGDKVNIEETLPYLLPQQQEDVLRAETQFFDESHADREHANGKGYMFTNGTGTGKTYTGLGIIKRFIKQGKGRILVLTPSKTKVDDWCKDAGNLSIDLVSLDKWADKRGTTATTEAGEGAVITTYANFRQNQALLESEFDLVVYDESHRLLENKKGENTTGAQQHYMVSNRNEREAMNRYRKISPVYESYRKAEEELAAAREALNLLRKHGGYNEIEAKETEYEKRVKEAESKRSDAEQAWEKEEERLRPIAEEAAKRTKVVFLSATPFNTRDNLEYAEGYIFSYPKEDENTVGSYRHKSPRSEFYLQQFGAGYKFRYGRLENSSGNAEALARQEVQFSDYLQNELGTMSGRIIDSEYDYSRDFPTVSLDMSDEINDAMQSVYRDDELRPLRNAMRGVWGDYNYSSALFETMKVAAMMPRIKAHLALGRKIVIFHRRVEVKQPLQPPYHRVLAIAKAEMDNTSDQNEKQALAGAIALFEKKYDTLLKWEATLDYSMPRVQIAKALGEENVLFFSGKESDKVKNKAVETFNDDDSGKNVIVIQEASGKEGISLHDRSGKHQRVCITLALPQSPITALQIEGRIYRIGNKSNAIFEYPLLGLDSEMMLFGQQFNSQVSTTENLALGSMARNLRESFAKGVEEHSGEVPLENQGIGGKEFDKPLDEERDAFDGAVLDYYGNQKLSGRRDSREGQDYFPTPEPLGFKMAEWAQLTEGETVLEPSAGHGAIARYVPRANGLTAVEPSNSLFSKLQIKAGGNGRKFVNDVFENYNVVNKHDAVLMNPPFGTAGRMTIDHLAKAFQHLEEGGRVIAIIPRGSTDVKFDKWYEEAKNAVMTGEIQLPDVLFERAGTKVRCRVVVIDKVSDKKLAMEASSKQVRVDLGKYDKIEDFFEGLKNVEMPRRTIDTNGIMAKKAKKAAKELEELKVVKSVEVNGVSINVKAKSYRDSYYFNWSGNDEIPLSKEEIRGKLAKEYNMLLRSSRDEEVKNAVRDMLVGMSGMTEEELSRYGTLNNNMGDVAKTAKAVADNAESIYTYEQGIHSKTGKTLHLAKPKERISPEQYAEMKAKAGEMGGYWSSFAKGFIFPSEETAKRFVDGAGIKKDSLLYRDGENIQRDGDDKGDTILPSKRFNARKVDVRFRQTDEVNRKFNEELSTLTEENADKVTFNLGTPSEVLLSAGIANKPMKLYGNKVIKKMKKHGFNLSELKNLPEAVANPIAVFDNLGREGNRSILTELKTENGNFLVTIDLGESKDIDFNIVSSVFGKTDNRVVNRINKGYATYINKEKALDYLYYPAPIAETPKSQELSSATKIVESFENPTLEQGKINAAVDELSESLHTSVKKITSVDQLPNGEARRRIEKGANVKGWFEPESGEVAVYLPNISNEDDAARTVLHEAVGHKGLRELFGTAGEKEYDAMMMKLYGQLPVETRRIVANAAIKEYTGDVAEAMDEYLAKQAESGDTPSWWNKVVSAVRDFLRKMVDVKLTDNDVKYLLWRSRKRLEKGNILEKAEDIAMRKRLKTGDYSNLRFRDGNDIIEKTPVLARDMYERRVSTGIYQCQEAFQDSMLALKEVYNAIGKAEGNKQYIEDVPSYENAYIAENALSSRNMAEMDCYKNLIFMPLLNEVAKIAKTDEGVQELIDYMMAKHGLERNRIMAERDAEKASREGDKGYDEYLEEYRRRDYAGLTALTETDNVAEAEYAAQNMVEKYESEHDVEELWNKTNAATKATLSKMHESGLLDKETYESIRDMYEYYIPLRGWEEKTSDKIYAYLASRDGAFNAPIRVAKGRSSKADNPLATIANMAESGIIQGNRNLMKQKFLNYALNHPSDLISISRLWLKHDDVNDEWVPVFADINQDDSPEEVERKVSEFNERMNQLAETEPDKYKQGKDAKNIPYKIVKENLKEHQVLIKRGGTDYVLTINGNPRAAQALNGLTNPDNDLSGAIGAILKGGEWVNRQLSGFYTTRNPDFVVSNFIRDALYANSMVWVKERPSYALKFHKNFGLVNPAVLYRLISKYRKGELDTDNETEKMFHQFMMNGGETGYANLKDIEKHKKAIGKELRKANGTVPIEKTWDLLGEKLDDMNRAVENCARFAAFMTSRQMGRSIGRSIWDAKEISVNFNKKGAGSKFLKSTGQTKPGNAASFISGGGRALFVFWNAAIQGTANVTRNAKRNPKKFAATTAAMFLLGAIVPALAGDGDDDDKNAYYNVPEYVRRSNIMFRYGDQWISIPLPVEYRAIYGLGELATSVMSGKEHLSGKEISTKITEQLSQLLPLDLMEGNGGFHSFIPSAVKPIAEAYTNTSWTGLPIYKETAYNKNMPEWTKAYKSANKQLVWLSSTLNEISGGDKYYKGSVDFNPARIEYMFKGYFGGYMNTIDKLIKMGETAMNERDFEWRNILLANRLLKSGDERTAFRKSTEEYFKYLDEYETTRQRLKGYEHEDDAGILGYAEKINFLENSPEYERYEIIGEYNNEIADLRSELKEAQDEEERKAIEYELDLLISELVRELHDTEK